MTRAERYLRERIQQALAEANGLEDRCRVLKRGNDKMLTELTDLELWQIADQLKTTMADVIEYFNDLKLRQAAIRSEFSWN